MFTMRTIIAASMSLLLAVSSSAQSVTADSTSSTSSASSSTSTPKVLRVNVGLGGGFNFVPNTTYANIGDTVEFVFYPTNHSVIRAEYTGSDACGPTGCNPCVPWETIHGSGGFNSTNVITGTIPDISSTTGATVWNYTVNTPDPIFYYCNAITSCNPNGMVGVINPNEAVSLDKQKAAAIAAPFQLAPDQAWPEDGTKVGAEGPTSSASPNATSSSHSDSSAHHSLSGGAIAGIVIGGLVVLGLAAGLFYFMGRHKSYKDMFRSSRSEHGGGGMSQTGDNVPWTPGPHSAPLTGGYRDNPSAPANITPYQDHRISHMTYNSQMTAPSDGGTFIGYNRNTGAPEFAAEAAAEQPGPEYSRHSSPMAPQGQFQSITTPKQPQQVFEAPGDTPGRREKE